MFLEILSVILRQKSLMRKMFLEKSLHIFSLYEIDIFYGIEFVFSFLFFDLSLSLSFFTEICLHELVFSALKPISLLLKWRNNELSEYEACYRCSIPNNLTKRERTSTFSLTFNYRSFISKFSPNISSTIGPSTYQFLNSSSFYCFLHSHWLNIWLTIC